MRLNLQDTGYDDIRMDLLLDKVKSTSSTNGTLRTAARGGALVNVPHRPRPRRTFIFHIQVDLSTFCNDLAQGLHAAYSVVQDLMCNMNNQKPNMSFIHTLPYLFTVPKYKRNIITKIILFHNKSIYFSLLFSIIL